MPSSPPISPGSKGSVLLIEEYGALAAAIRAALKKFAPSHAVSRVRSLSAALTAARGKAPDFVILDFDPPFPGILDFFSLLREIAPATRVMIIAANLPQPTLRDERLPTAFSFVEKPFQLAEFGAAITRLIALSDAENEGSARTALEAMSLTDLIPLLGIENLTGTVGVTAAEGALVGELAFDQGKIPNAAASGLQGIDALREMLRWPAPEFDFTEGSSDAPPQMEGKWPRVLDKVIRSIPRPPARVAAMTAGRKSARSARAKVAPPIVKNGPKILIIDDTETLRIFAEEMLSESDPRLQIVSAADAASGLKHCASLRPDLILLDFSLPDINGDEVCRRLLEDEATREIPVIMMSGHVADMAEAAAHYENIVLALSKPFVSADLIQAVTKTLAKPPERRRRKTPPVATKTELKAPKAEHKTNGHSAIPTAGPAAKLAPPVPPVALPEPMAAPPPPPPPESLHPSASAFAPEPEPAPPEPSAEVALVPEFPPPEPAPMPAAPIPAHIAVASRDAVVLTMELEVISMQFSPALQIIQLRAKPKSSSVLLHVDPRAVSAVSIPEIAFEISRAELDDAGQVQTLHIVPAPRKPAVRPHDPGVPVERLALLPGESAAALQLTPAGAAHLTVRLLAAFELTAVELSPTFSVSLFLLRARSGRMRVVLPGHGGRGGPIFEATRVSLDSTGRIEEMDLHIAPPLETRTPSLRD